MKVIISDFSEADQCQWCNRNIEGVTVEFDSQFIAPGHLCWKCLQRSTRVYAAQNGQVESAAAPKSAKDTEKS